MKEGLPNTLDLPEHLKERLARQLRERAGTPGEAPVAQVIKDLMCFYSVLHLGLATLRHEFCREEMGLVLSLDWSKYLTPGDFDRSLACRAPQDFGDGMTRVAGPVLLSAEDLRRKALEGKWGVDLPALEIKVGRLTDAALIALVDLVEQARREENGREDVLALFPPSIRTDALLQSG